MKSGFSHLVITVSKCTKGDPYGFRRQSNNARQGKLGNFNRKIKSSADCLAEALRGKCELAERGFNPTYKLNPFSRILSLMLIERRCVH